MIIEIEIRKIRRHASQMICPLASSMQDTFPRVEAANVSQSDIVSTTTDITMSRGYREHVSHQGMRSEKDG